MFESGPDDFSRLLLYGTFQVEVCPSLACLLLLTLSPEEEILTLLPFVYETTVPGGGDAAGGLGRFRGARQFTFPNVQPRWFSPTQIWGDVSCRCCRPCADGIQKDPEVVGDLLDPLKFPARFHMGVCLPGR